MRRALTSGLFSRRENQDNPGTLIQSVAGVDRGRHHRRDARFHIAGSSAEKALSDDIAAEGIEFPRRATERNRVQMPGKTNWHMYAIYAEVFSPPCN